eukprot:scaffold98_cov307-Prasinococcus_capsulatus_cf.AAC.2
MDARSSSGARRVRSMRGWIICGSVEGQGACLLATTAMFPARQQACSSNSSRSSGRQRMRGEPNRIPSELHPPDAAADYAPMLRRLRASTLATLGPRALVGNVSVTNRDRVRQAWAGAGQRPRGTLHHRAAAGGSGARWAARGAAPALAAREHAAGQLSVV